MTSDTTHPDPSALRDLEKALRVSLAWRKQAIGLLREAHDHLMTPDNIRHRIRKFLEQNR